MLLVLLLLHLALMAAAMSLQTAPASTLLLGGLEWRRVISRIQDSRA
jgi:hypothetical protein